VNDGNPDAIKIRSRTVGRVYPADDDTVIVVEHVYAPEGAVACEDCGKPSHDPGMVGLVISSDDEDGDGDGFTSVLMDAEDALLLANRLTRAASLVLESQEDNPDIEREAARFTAAERGAPDA
jgi:hypothetical protein